MFERTQPTVERSSSEWFGAWQPVEPLATAGSVALWRATRENGGSALLRLYPRFQRQDTWRRFRSVAARRSRLPDITQLVAVSGVGSYGRPHLLLEDPVGEPLATRIEREPLSPQVALQVFADVAAGLDALAHAGVPPVDLSPADVFVVGDRGALLADVGTLGEVLRGRCLNLDHAAPERAAMAERGGDGPIGQLLARLSPWHAPRPTTATMSYSFTSVLQAALAGPAAGAAAPLPPRLRRVIERTLAPRYRRRYRSPGQVVKAFRAALESNEPEQAPSERIGAPSEPAPSAADSAAERPARGLGRRASALVAVSVVAAAAAAGTIAGVATTPSDPPGPSRLTGDGLSVRAPAGWTRAPASAAPFDAGSKALVVRSPIGPRAGLTVTRSAGPLLARLPGAEPGAVELAGGDAWRYAGVRVGGAPADVYVLDTAAGPVAAACLAPDATGRETLAICGGVVGTLRVRDVKAVALGGSATARARLDRALDALSRDRRRGRQALASAGRSPGQAAAASRLSAAYARAGGTVATGTTVGAPGDRRRLVAALEATEGSYADLAAAARSRDPGAYDSARRQIAEHERDVRAAVAALARTPATD